MSLNLSELTPSSTLANLVAYNYQTNIYTLGQAVSQKFQNQPELPGVIVMDGRQMVGMISQRKFLERMSLPYASEVHFRRPIQVLLNLVKIEPLQLSINCKIEQAARIALSRSLELVYEPIVVIQEGQLPSLIDIRDLLLAQNQILIAVNIRFEQQREQASKELKELKKEVEMSEVYVRLLEEKQLENRRQNKVIELQQVRLKRQAKQINDFSRQLVRLSQFLYLEGRKAFTATYDGVNSISHTTKQIVSTGNSLIEELENINNANSLIASVSKQVRHLALQAAVAANKAGNQLTEFSYIAHEIRSLGGKTFEASTQLNQIANRFKDRIPESIEAARLGESTSRSLLQKIEQAQVTLTELEDLVNRNIHDQQPNLKSMTEYNLTEINEHRQVTTQIKLRLRKNNRLTLKQIHSLPDAKTL